MMKVYIFILALLAVTVNGKDCNNDDDCDMTNAICKKGMCICPSGFVANSLNTECLAVALGYGSNCTDSIQCSTSLRSGGLCSNNICICSEGYHYYLGRCWKSSDLGSPCKHNENCFVSYDFEAASCSDKKVCECSPGYYQREYSSCRRKSYNPGDSCGIPLDCQYKDAVCTKDRKCGQNETAALHITHDIELNNGINNKKTLLTTLINAIGNSCGSNKDCPTNAECNERNICVCKEGFFLHNDLCSPELGASCSKDDDCVGKNMMCRNGTYCACKQGFVASISNQYCDKMSRYLGWSCLNDRECGFFGPRSICLKKKCQCDNNTHYVENVMYCWISKNAGDTCVTNEDCGGVDTMECSKGVCQCIENTHASSDKSVCRKDSKNLGDSCEENLDCRFENSYCNFSSHFCECVKGYLYKNGTCVPGVLGKCTNNSDCCTEGTSCVNGTCTCQKNYVGSGDFQKCLPIVSQLHGQCSESVQCEQIDGLCMEGQCSCKTKYHYVENAKCFESRYIGQPCTSEGNCRIVKNAACFKGICSCYPGYTSSHDGTICSSADRCNISFFSVMLLILFIFINRYL